MVLVGSQEETGCTHYGKPDTLRAIQGGRSKMKPECESSQRLQDRVALITGAGGTNSIGRAIAMRFAQEGARVGVLTRHASSATQVVKDIEAAGGFAIPLTCDVTDLDQCRASAKQLADVHGGKIDILVNNAAAARVVPSRTGLRLFDDYTVDEWDEAQDVNLKGMWFSTQAVFPYMKPQGYGKIINITSSAFFEGLRGFIPYVASKGGIIGFTRALARELGEFGIRVNALAPGFTLTDSNAGQGPDYLQHCEHTREKQCLNVRNEIPEDLAGPAFFLASPDSDFMSGQTLLVDGGLIMH
jgi:3-oxoacyl-[acyl-carrier protein] reductase